MLDYARARAEFRWAPPESFNFAADVVDAWARDPAKLALLWCNEAGEERRYTFAQMRELSCRLAGSLAAHGLRKGDRVVVMLPRIPEWQVSMLACLRLGAIPVPCIEMLTAKDVGFRVAHSGARAAIAARASADKFGPLPVRIAVGGAPGWIDFDDALAGQLDRP